MPYLVGYVTPQDYGAVGNNSTDDTTAIQAAINAISTAGGGTLLIPGNTFKTSSALSIPNGVSLMGLGPGVSVINQTSTTANAITYNPTSLSYISIENLSITGPGSGSGVGVLVEANSGSANATSCSFDDLVISGFGSHGFELVNGVGCSFETVNVSSVGGHCFFLSGGSGNTMANCFANGGATTEQGFQLTSVTYSTLSGCKAFGCGGGYTITTGSANQINGCGADTIVAANGQDGTGFKISGGTANAVYNSYSNINKAKAFWVTGSSSNAVVLGCEETAPGAGATASIQVDTGSTAAAVYNTTSTATSYTAGTTTQLSAGQLTLVGPVAGQPTASGNTVLSVNVNGTQSFDALRILGTGQIAIGTGTAARDAFFGRAGTNTTYAEPNLLVGGTTALGDNGNGEIQLANVTSAPSTNPSGGAVIYARNGGLITRDSNGGVFPLVDGPNVTGSTTNSIAETVPRIQVTTSAGPTSGQLFIQSIWVPAGVSIGHVGFATGTTAASGPTHWWAAVLDNTYKQQAHSTDQTTGAIAASTWFNLAMATPYVTTYSGTYYLALLVATSTTQPTILQSANTPAAQFWTGTSAPTPVPNGASTASLTTPGTDGTTTYAAPTVASAPFYLYCAA